jgi:hypothetical protein
MAWYNQHDPEEDYIIVPVIPDDGTAIHNESGFCYDTTHECHENPDTINDLNAAIVEGEITTEDAGRIYRGRTV